MMELVATNIVSSRAHEQRLAPAGNIDAHANFGKISERSDLFASLNYTETIFDLLNYILINLQ